MINAILAHLHVVSNPPLENPLNARKEDRRRSSCQRRVYHRVQIPTIIFQGNYLKN
jgi:hypothetical protein